MKRKLLLSAIGMFFFLTMYSQPIKVMLISGGHSYDSVAFFNLFDSLAGIEYEHYTQPLANNQLVKGITDQYDVLVFYDMWKLISKEEKEAYIELTRRGIPMLFLHHALVSYQEWPEFERIIGGRYIENDKVSKENQSTYQHDVWMEIEIADKQHPVTAGMIDFKLFDEIYGNYKVLPEVKPLLLTNHPKSTTLIGWENKYNASSIIYIQPGHNHHAYSSVDYQRLIKQAIYYLKMVAIKK